MSISSSHTQPANFCYLIQCADNSQMCIPFSPNRNLIYSTLVATELTIAKGWNLSSSYWLLGPSPPAVFSGLWLSPRFSFKSVLLSMWSLNWYFPFLCVTGVMAGCARFSPLKSVYKESGKVQQIPHAACWNDCSAADCHVCQPPMWAADIPSKWTEQERLQAKNKDG